MIWSALGGGRLFTGTDEHAVQFARPSTPSRAHWA